MRILVQDSDGLRSLAEGYASELEMQTFLKTYPDLMPLEDIDIGAPALLCIGWEVGVVSGAEDILYIDQSGLLTLVETKLQRNPESRRAVVGQVLEYAAHMSNWTSLQVQQIADRFFAGQYCSKEYAGLTLEAALQKRYDNSMPYEEFLAQVQANIDGGRFRLVIAIDEIPEPLLRTVEFVNKFSKHFELYLIQLKRFRDVASEQNVFVPALFGAVARVETSPTRRPGRIWDEESFLELAQRNSPESLSIYRQLIDAAKRANRITWGHGATLGTFGYVIPFGRGIPAFNCNSAGKITLDFKTMNDAGVSPDATAGYREGLRRASAIPDDVVNNQTWKEFHARLLGPGAIEAFLQAVQGFDTALST